MNSRDLRNTRRIALTALFVVLACAAPRAAAASIEAYAFSVAGQSSCATFGPTAQVLNTVLVSSIEASTPGPGCSVLENLQDQMAAAGVLSATSTASGGGLTSFGSYSYSGSSQSKATFNTLGVEAQGTLTGAPDSSSAGSSEAFGEMTDSFLVAGPSGQSGYLQLNYSVDGTQTLSGRGSTVIELLWRENNGPQFGAFRVIDSSLSGPSVSINGDYVTNSPGITVSPGEVDVNADESFLLPFNFNQKFTLNLVLYGSAYPGSTTGLSGPSSIDNNFFSTVTLTSLDVLDIHGNPIAGAQVQRDSAATPEPPGLLLAGCALAALSRLRAKRRFRCAAAALAVLWMGTALPGRADTVTQYLNFAAVNQSQWQAGPGTVIDRTYSLPDPALSANVTAASINTNPAGALLDVLGGLLGISLDDLASVKLTPQASFSAALTAQYHINGGTLNLNYPTDVQLTAPSQITSGKTFTISSGIPDNSASPLSKLQVPVSQLTAAAGAGYAALGEALGYDTQSGFRTSAGFTTTFPYADASVGVNFQASASIQAQACVLLFCGGGSIDLPSVGKNVQVVEVNTLNGIKILDNNFVSFNQTYSADGFVDLTLHSPNVSVSGTLNGSGALVGGANSSVLTVGFDVAQLLPVVGQLLDANFAGIGYNLLKVEPQLSLGVYQNMSFQPTSLMVDLQFNQPVIYNGKVTREIVAPVGQALNVTPAVVGGFGGSELVVRPTYMLDNTFINQTGLSVSGELDVDALQILEPFSTDPLVHKEFDLGTLDLPPLETDEFTVEVGQITTADVDLGENPDLGLLLTYSFTGVTEPDGGAQLELSIDGTPVGTGEQDYVPPVGGTISDCIGFGFTGICDTVFMADNDIIYGGQDLGRFFCVACTDSETGFNAVNPILNEDFGSLFLSDLSTYASIPTPDQVIASDPVFSSSGTYYDNSSFTPGALVPNPEPGTMVLAAAGLIAVLRKIGVAERLRARLQAVSRRLR